MQRLPIVSILIVSCNRLAELRETVQSCLRLVYPRKEIIVVDNASEDGTEDYARRLGERVRYMRLRENFGPCVARNRGFGAAQGEIVVGLDDDSRFINADGLGSVVERFEREPRLAVQSFPVVTREENCGQRSFNRNGQFNPHFQACACAYRVSAVKAAGGYDESLFMCGEEEDLAVRLMDKGWYVKHYDQPVVYHAFTSTSRSWGRRAFLCTRNLIIFLWRYMPLWLAATWSPVILCKMMAHAIRSGRATAMDCIAGALAFIGRLPKVLRNRHPVTPETAKRYYYSSYCVVMGEERYEAAGKEPWFRVLFRIWNAKTRHHN